MTNPSYKLISFSICPFVQRARIVMLEKQIPHTVEYIDLHNPPSWFLDVSPLEKVPVLMVDDQALFESMPICEYLDEISPGSLYPADPFDKARHRAWIEFANDILSQLQALVGAADEPGHKRARALLMDRLDTLEEVIGEGPFFAGESFGMVDAVYAPLFRIIQHLHELAGLELISNETPKVAVWADQVLLRVSVREAVPASFKQDYLANIRRQQGHLSQRLTN